MTMTATTITGIDITNFKLLKMTNYSFLKLEITLTEYNRARKMIRIDGICSLHRFVHFILQYFLQSVGTIIKETRMIVEGTRAQWCIPPDLVIFHVDLIFCYNGNSKPTQINQIIFEEILHNYLIFKLIN